MNIYITMLIGCCILFSRSATAGEEMPTPQIPFSPQLYVCYRALEPIAVDGRLTESSWQKAEETNPFVDIQGDLKPSPRFATRAKMLWDSTYFYIGAELEEPDVWGTLTERDAVIYHDNDFEVFIDPDGDTHEYYELELNALNTVWDLFLVKPYRDGGPAVNAWDIQGLKTAVAVRGTLNTPGDRDSGWSVEIAIPWKVLAECAHRPSPPNDGDQWRINFSRVEWQTDVNDGKYVKRPGPEDNWVWSPQGLIAMHYPEMWGIVQFSTLAAGAGTADYEYDHLDGARWALRIIYYAEHGFYRRHNTFSTDYQAISNIAWLPNPPAGFSWPPRIEATAHQFRAETTRLSDSSVVWITQDGCCRVEHK